MHLNLPALYFDEQKDKTLQIVANGIKRHLFDHIDGKTSGPSSYNGPIGMLLDECETEAVIEFEPIPFSYKIVLSAIDIGLYLQKKVSKPASPVRTSARIFQKLRHKEPVEATLTKDNTAKKINCDKRVEVVNKDANHLVNKAIVYARLPSGEIIGNIIKQTSNNGNFNKLSVQSMASNDNVKAKSLKSKNTGTSSQTLLAQYNKIDCPIDEFNVEEVLHTSIRATQSMRMFLSSIRDDLKRLVATSTPSSMITAEQIKKRKDLADKLHRAYSGYKHAINCELLAIDKKSKQFRTAKISNKLTLTKTYSNETDVIELSEESDVE
ncbi:hypothetical protein HELRODRAFT_162600 [Helobdella robusta]|uniref:Uncharacterized protein n=1 Tax=Helobdella robusta TaxID=6412 RepID=T1ESW8_HELRO|nr:hypothetical protein HELRODRAFT_162600 [Helobdella robusta]ESN99109.1 hypothetical protein HELRODRAFT_162600 [Helobdella robusta]